MFYNVLFSPQGFTHCISYIALLKFFSNWTSKMCEMWHIIYFCGNSERHIAYCNDFWCFDCGQKKMCSNAERFTDYWMEGCNWGCPPAGQRIHGTRKHPSHVSIILVFITNIISLHSFYSIKPRNTHAHWVSSTEEAWGFFFLRYFFSSYDSIRISN